MKRHVGVYVNGERIGIFETDARSWQILVDYFFSNVTLEPIDINEWPELKGEVNA